MGDDGMRHVAMSRGARAGPVVTQKRRRQP